MGKEKTRFQVFVREWGRYDLVIVVARNLEEAEKLLEQIDLTSSLMNVGYTLTQIPMDRPGAYRIMPMGFVNPWYFPR